MGPHEVTHGSGSPVPTFPEMVVFPNTAQFTGFSGRQPTSAAVTATVTATVTVRWAFVEGG